MLKWVFNVNTKQLNMYFSVFNYPTSKGINWRVESIRAFHHISIVD